MKYERKTSQKKKTSNINASRQAKHAADAPNGDKDLCRSDAFLRDCFNDGQSIYVLTAPVNTNDKNVLKDLETNLILLMWSLTTKTRKLKNAALSDPNVTVNYVKSVQILQQMIEFSELLKLSKIRVNGQYEEMIDWSKFDFGSPPKPLPIAYNPDEIIVWLGNEEFN